jgi:hypothetical protein
MVNLVTLQYLDDELGTQLLGAGAQGVRQMLRVDAYTVRSVADTIALCFKKSVPVPMSSLIIIGNSQSCRHP